MTDQLSCIAEGVQSGDAAKVVEHVHKALESGIPPQRILEEGLIPGIQALGRCFKEGSVYLPEILISTRAMNQGLQIVRPHMGQTKAANKGKVIIGTVEGDMHDIGKNMVKMMLESSGFEVEDLGTDVTAEDFVAAARQFQPDIVAMSALLTVTMVSMAGVTDALRKEGLQVKIMIGGAPITREFADRIGADGFAADCVAAVDEAIRLTAKTQAG